MPIEDIVATKGSVGRLKKRVQKLETNPVGTGSALTVEEVDAAPSVTNVSKIVVSNGTLTDDGGGQVTVTTSGGGAHASTHAQGGADPLDQYYAETIHTHVQTDVTGLFGYYADSATTATLPIDQSDVTGLSGYYQSSTADLTQARITGLQGYYQSSTADLAQTRITGLFGYYQPSATFAEDVSDQIGTMVTGNTETNITVTYQDADNTLDFVVPAASDTTAGVIEIATDAEVTTATDTSRAITPSSVDAIRIAQSQVTGLSGYYQSSTASLPMSRITGLTGYHLSSVSPLPANHEASDHGTAATDMLGNWCYGTSSTPPTASTTTEGALYFMYSA